MNHDRDWNDPIYKAWRVAVYKRDKYCCRMPGCKKKGFSAKIQAHHIRRWSDEPDLRFQVSNGITLCKTCHQRIEGQEMSYSALFDNIITGLDSFTDVKRIFWKRDTEEQSDKTE